MGQGVFHFAKLETVTSNPNETTVLKINGRQMKRHISGREPPDDT